MRDASALQVTAVCVLLWALVLGSLTVVRFDGDPRAFLCLGARFHHPPALDGAPRTSEWGYDGQFYGVLATDPLLLEERTVRSIDTPAYRGRRILLPLTAWLASAGHGKTAPFVYLGLCWVAGLAGVCILARQLEAGGRSPWLAMLYGLSGGLVVSMVRATPDAAATTLVLAGLWAAQAQRPRRALVAFVAAAMTRDTAVLAALAQASHELWKKSWRRALPLVLLPALGVGAWTAVLSARFGFSGGGGARNFALPMRGAAERTALLLCGQLSGVESLGLLAVLGTMAAAAVLVIRGERSPTVLSLAAFSALAAVLGSSVWEEVYASLRVLGILAALAIACVAGGSSRTRTALLLAGPLLAAVAGLILVRIELVPAFPALGNLKGLARELLGRLL